MITNSIPKLNFNSNYNNWALLVEAVLISQSLWDNNEPAESPAAWSLIIQSVSEDVLKLLYDTRSYYNNLLEWISIP